MRSARPLKTPPDACLSCGTPADPGQEYCLGCGARIVPVPRFSTIGRMWERRLGRYPGDWIWASLALLLVAAGSATAGIVAGRDTGSPGAPEAIVATSPVVTAPPQPPAATTQPAPKPSTTPAPAPTPAPGTSPAEWPARNGYTVVLASIPARGTGLAEAKAKAEDARSRGLRSVGVLDSGRFASLHPGYYVVFAGVYDSLDEALTAVRKAASRFPNAYARQISR